MSKWKVIEKDNPNAVHAYADSKERADEWIEKYGDGGMFVDKTLNKDSFEVIEETGFDGE